MSLTALPVTMADLTQLQLGIEFFTNNAEATTEVALINAGTDTVDAYAHKLLANNISLSQAVMAVDSLMYGVTDSVTELANLSTKFAPAQVANALANGLNPTVYACEAIGLGLATGNGTSTAFATNFGSLSVSQFAAAVATITGVNVNAIQQFAQNWINFYTKNGTIGGIPVTLASYGAAFGDAVGVDLVNNPPGGAIQAAVANALFDNAQGTYQVGVPIFNEPTAAAFQGGTSLTFTLTQNADSGPAFTTSVPGAIFNALPAAGVNTLNTGDNLQDSANDGTLNQTITATGINPPLATGVTMNGISKANITNATTGTGGFTGNITGLTQVTLMAASLGNVQLGTGGQGLNTALATIEIQANQGFTAWMTAAALGAASDTVAINLNGAGGVATTVNLDVTSGTNGYETVNVNSGGGGHNSLVLNTNATSTSTIVVTGAQNLLILGDALTIADLHTFNGSAATGDLSVNFSGTGHVAATGGSGNDTFHFFTLGGVTFNSTSSVNGGGGTNILDLSANGGDLLLSGVGPNITNIQTIFHSGGLSSDLAVDMSRAGSATVVDLDANYTGHNVNVTNLTDALSVTFSGSNGELFLHHTGVVGTDNLTISGGAMLTSLHTDGGFGLALASVGSFTNQITDISGLHSNVSISGGALLQFGSIAAPYSFVGGTIDATTDTGGVTTFLARDSTALPDFAGTETFVGGTGSDFVHELDFRGDVVNFSSGGADTVEFREARYDASFLLSNTTHQYNNVLGFSANDTVAINNEGAVTIGSGGRIFTTTGVQVAAGDALHEFNYTTGAIVNISGTLENYIHINGGVSTSSAQISFNSAIGVAGSITVSGTHEFLASYYDITDSQAVFITVDSTAGTIAFNADVDVIATIGMSQATYDAMGNVAFT